MNKTKSKSNLKNDSKIRQNGFQQEDHTGNISDSTCFEKAPATGKNGFINGAIVDKCNSLSKGSKKSDKKNKSKHSKSKQECKNSKDCCDLKLPSNESVLNEINSSSCDKDSVLNENKNSNKFSHSGKRGQDNGEWNRDDCSGSDSTVISNKSNTESVRTKREHKSVQNDSWKKNKLKQADSKLNVNIPTPMPHSTAPLLEDATLKRLDILNFQDGQCMPSTSVEPIRTSNFTTKELLEGESNAENFTDYETDVIEKIEKIDIRDVKEETKDKAECNLENKAENPDLPQIEYVQYESELQMPMIMKIIQKDLSEPYSIYTYRYFIHNWPKLCFLAMCEGKCVGAIVCKLDMHRKVIKRGYIAMLAVDENYRKRRIGSTLVRRAIEEMISGGADEVVLETEVTNKPALKLYEQLGFVRDKRLFRYYLNGVDALRLKLWLR